MTNAFALNVAQAIEDAWHGKLQIENETAPGLQSRRYRVVSMHEEPRASGNVLAKLECLEGGFAGDGELGGRLIDLNFLPICFAELCEFWQAEILREAMPDAPPGGPPIRLEYEVTVRRITPAPRGDGP